MANIIIPRSAAERWSQPQGPVEVDDNHPLRSALVKAVLPTNRRYSTKMGMAGTCRATLTVAESDSIVNGFTLVGGVFWNNYSSVSEWEKLGVYLSQTTGTFPSDHDAAGIERNGTNQTYQLIFRRDSASNSGTLTIPWRTGDYVFQEIVVPGTVSGSTATYYENGSVYTGPIQSSNPTPFRTGVSRVLQVGNGLATTAGPTSGTHVYLFRGSLSSSWRESLRANPWQLFRPVTQRIFVGV